MFLIELNIGNVVNSIGETVEIPSSTLGPNYPRWSRVDLYDIKPASASQWPTVMLNAIKKLEVKDYYDTPPDVNDFPGACAILEVTEGHNSVLGKTVYYSFAQTEGVLPNDAYPSLLSVTAENFEQFKNRLVKVPPGSYYNFTNIAGSDVLVSGNRSKASDQFIQSGGLAKVVSLVQHDTDDAHVDPSKFAPHGAYIGFTAQGLNPDFPGNNFYYTPLQNAQVKSAPVTAQSNPVMVWGLRFLLFGFLAWGGYKLYKKYKS